LGAAGEIDKMKNLLGGVSSIVCVDKTGVPPPLLKLDEKRAGGEEAQLIETTPGRIFVRDVGMAGQQRFVFLPLQLPAIVFQ
jgi:hypothetical protein